MKNFRVLFLFLCISLLVCTASAQKGQPVVGGHQAGSRQQKPLHHPAWINSVDDAFERAEKENKLVIIDAFASWCGWCKRLDKDVLDTQKFVDLASPLYVLLRLNTEDKGEGTRFAQQHGIRNLPTTTVMDYDRTVVGKAQGYLPYEKFVIAIEEFRTSYLALQQMQKEAVTSDDPALLLDLATQWKDRGSPERSLEAASRVADSPKSTSQQRAWGAYTAAASALRLQRSDEASLRLQQLETIKPFPAEMNGLPELLRADMAKLQNDFDGAIAILDDLLQNGDSSPQWKANIPNQLRQLKVAKMMHERQTAGQKAPQ